jgi:hypothetical protein
MSQYITGDPGTINNARSRLPMLHLKRKRITRIKRKNDFNNNKALVT